MSIDKDPVSWDLDISPLIGVPVVIETEDGMYRNTIITALKCKDVDLGGMLCPLPERFILENNESDFIDLRVIKSVKKKT